MSNYIPRKIIDHLYLLVPTCCISFWALISLIKDNFNILGASDFPAIYYAAKYIFTKPELVYSDAIQPQYPYTPCIATIFAPIALLSFETAHWIYFIITLLLSYLLIINFDQILKIKNVDRKLHRILFLLAISNGLRYVQLFDYLTSKMWTACFLIIFIRREIEYRELNKDRENIKYKFVQWMILIFAIGISPQFFFLIFLYLFYNIKFKDIFTKKQIQNYLLMILVFTIQNFMIFIIFFVAPESIFFFFGGSWRGRKKVYWRNLTYEYLIKNRVRLPTDVISHFFQVLSLHYDLSALNFDLLLLSLIIMSLITILIHHKKNLKLEEKFGYFSLFALLFYTMIAAPRYYIVLLPAIEILFIKHFEDCETLTNFIKTNFLILLGLVCIVLLYFMPEIHYLARVFPIIINIPIELVLLRADYIYALLMIVIIKLSRRKIQNFDYHEI
ncbi:MAG: hypothetical protein ACFFHV_17945 [Promethearchaeota archaeon]